MFGKNRLQITLISLLIFLLLFIAGCRATVEETFTPITRVPTPTAVTAQLPEEIKKARDVTLTYIGSKYDIELPTSDADWTVEYDILEDIIGAGAYRMTTDSCVVTISNPTMSLDSATYYVILDDATAGFHWEGDVDCQGHVMPSWSSVDTQTVSGTDTINIVELVDLHTTVGIEVCRLDCASYTPLYTIGNPDLIADLVNALDTDMPLRPHARCPATYQLRFILADGQQYDFGYTDLMTPPTFLRGNQDFWMDQDAVAPEAFNELLLPLITPKSAREYQW